MRISDWSSDVCSSDLADEIRWFFDDAHNARAVDAVLTHVTITDEHAVSAEVAGKCSLGWLLAQQSVRGLGPVKAEKLTDGIDTVEALLVRIDHELTMTRALDEGPAAAVRAPLADAAARSTAEKRGGDAWG